MTDTLICNAAVVNEGRIRPADVLLSGGRITRIDREIPAKPGVAVVDLAGRHLLPGMIDDQVHFREPGLTHKGDIATESRAAVAGGITSFMDMPNVKPPTLTRALLRDKYRIAAAGLSANYAFYLGASNDNLDEIVALKPGEACGVKVFMGASTGNMLVDDPQTLQQIFARTPVPVITHCEDTPTIIRNEARYRRRYGVHIPMRCHPRIRSVDACFQSTALAVDLARRNATRLHVLHLTSERELGLFSDAPLEDKHITLEVCAHHLFFNAGDYAEKGGLIKCNPAIKNETDRVALIRGVRDNVVDVIATDHAPHTLAEKQGDYFTTPAGLPLVQHALPSLFEHYHRGMLTLETIVQKTAHAPAQIFGVVDRGYIREGYWADLVAVDLDAPFLVTRDNVLYKCGWSPFEGYTFASSVTHTWVNGEVVYQGGAVTGMRPGRPLELNNYEAR